MIGIILLLIAIFLYFRPKYRYLSYFLYLSFMMGTGGGGFGLWTDEITGIKNGDCAVIYTFIASLSLVFRHKWKIPKIKGRGMLIVFILFLLSSCCFSYFYYELTPYQILQGARSYLLIFSLPVLLQATPSEVYKVMRLLFWMCLFTSVLYILQILVVKGPIMPYPGTPGIDPTTGLVRMHNAPANLIIFLTLSFLCPALMPKNIKLNLIRAILLVALMCNLGRTAIATGIFMVLLALLMNGSFKKIGGTIIVIGILTLPFIGTISNRFEEGGTSNDINQIFEGKFDENYTNEGDATMLYRFAWCYERANYLASRPLGEQIFGMGFCSDSQDWVYKHYSFNLGLPNKERMQPYQLQTPDISFGNMITGLGFVGTIIYLLFYLCLVRYFWRYRKCNILFLLMSAYTLILTVIAFAGSNLSEVRTLSLLFLIMSLAFHSNGIGLMAFDKSKAE